MNLSDDLTPASDPAPLLRAVRSRRRRRLATRICLPVAVGIATVISLWPRPASREPTVAIAPPANSAAPIVSVPASTPPPVTMTRDELMDSLKDQTYALIRWPDGREQLLIRR